MVRDVVVYDSTPGGIMAAVAGKIEGQKKKGWHTRKLRVQSKIVVLTIATCLPSCKHISMKNKTKHCSGKDRGERRVGCPD